jgi:signal transduction histidine kinase
MKTDDGVRVLLLANEFDSARIMLEESHSGTGLTIVGARSRKEFARRIKEKEIEVVVAETAGLPELPLSEVLEIAAARELPLVLLGEDGDDGYDAIRALRKGAADYIPASQMERLPVVIRRVLRERELMDEQERLQEQLQQVYDVLLENQKLVSVGRLAASIAHEINNPLEAVTNLLYLLRLEPNLSDAARSYVAAAELEMERVAQISKQTLNFHRETRLPVRVQPSDLLDEVLVLYARRLEERRIEVVRQYRSAASLVVFPGELRQVFSNLVANAIEASPVGGKLTLRVRRAHRWSESGANGVRIVIADNGCGIPAESRRRLGELFYTTKGQRGTGLGLWITQAIVKRYGGELQLYSSVREGRHGTAFSIFVPTNVRPMPVSVEGVPPENSPEPRDLSERARPDGISRVKKLDRPEIRSDGKRGKMRGKLRSVPSVAS